MMWRSVLTLLIVVLIQSAAYAQVPPGAQSRTAVQSELTAYFPDQNIGAIQPSTMRSYENVLTNSSLFALSNLGDLGNIITARSNLGLGGFASLVAGTSCVPVTDSLNNPTCGQTLPSPVQANISRLGTITQNTATSITALSGDSIRLIGANASPSRVENVAFGGAAYFTGVRSDGTAASPATIVNGDEISSLNALGNCGVSAPCGPAGAFRIFANESWASGHQGTYADIAATPNGSTTMSPVMIFTGGGGMAASGVAGGDKGAGTINVTGVYINGTPGQVQVNGTFCLITGINCSVTATASSITPGGTAVISGTSGSIEYNNGGVLGEKTTTGSGSVVLATAPTLTGLVAATGSFAVGTSTVVNGSTIEYDTPAGLTGPGTISVSGTTTTGTGTFFVESFQNGDAITSGANSAVVVAVASDTSMTTTAWSPGNPTAGSSYTITGGQRWRMQMNGQVVVGGLASSWGSAPRPFTVSKTFLDQANSSAILVGITNVSNLNQTSQAFASIDIGAYLSASVGATNTQNWSNSIGLYGVVSSPSISSGATGTITGAAAYSTLFYGNSSSTATLTNLYGVLVNTPNNTGTITNFAGLDVAAVTQATNNTLLLLGTSAIPPGNFAIYSASANISQLGGPLTLLAASGSIGITLNAATGGNPNLWFQSGASVLSLLTANTTNPFYATDQVNSGATFISLSSTGNLTLGEGGTKTVAIAGITGSTQCLQANTFGVVSGTGTTCGTGSGSVSGPASSVVGNVTLWNNTTGTSLKDGGYVPVNKAGDTMTGGLTIAPASGASQIVINAPVSNQDNIYLQSAGVSKWQIFKQTDDTFHITDINSGLTDILISTTGNIILGEGATHTVTVPNEFIVNDPGGLATPTINFTGGSPTSYTQPNFQFVSNTALGSFGDGAFRIPFSLIGGKTDSGANVTGSWNFMVISWLDDGGGTSSSFIVSFQPLMSPTASSFNNNGHIFSENPIIGVPTGMNTAEVTIAEFDTTNQSPTSQRNGIRIFDICSNQGGSTCNSENLGSSGDTGLTIAKAGNNAVGFNNLVNFGDNSTASGDPLRAGGNAIHFEASGVAYSSLFDAHSLTGNPTNADVWLPPHSGNQFYMCFGSTCGGGGLVGATTVNGGQIVFANNSIQFSWSAAAFQFSNTGALTITSLANAAGNEILCYNTVSGAVTYALNVTGCGASAKALKNIGPDLVPADALAGIMGLVSGSWTFKDKVTFGGRVYVGLYADDVCGMDERLCDRDANGKVKNYDKVGIAAYTIAALQGEDIKLNQEIANREKGEEDILAKLARLQREVDDLKIANDNLKAANDNFSTVIKTQMRK